VFPELDTECNFIAVKTKRTSHLNAEYDSRIRIDLCDNHVEVHSNQLRRLTRPSFRSSNAAPGCFSSSSHRGLLRRMRVGMPNLDSLAVATPRSVKTSMMSNLQQESDNLTACLLPFHDLVLLLEPQPYSCLLTCRLLSPTIVLLRQCSELKLNCSASLAYVRRGRWQRNPAREHSNWALKRPWPLFELNQ